MIESIKFVVKNYAALFLLILVFWGFGIALLKCICIESKDKWIDFVVACVIGIGIFILILQILAIGGWLRRSGLNVISFVGLLLAGAQLISIYRNKLVGSLYPSINNKADKSYWIGLGLIFFAFVPTLIAPLSPPRDWDELMYHLPHANQWAQTGRLTVNEWLRYPWFPYNFNLLYSVALILRGDVLAHLIHALAGWLVALLIYRLAVRYSSRVTAIIATLIWLGLTNAFFSNAYVELGLALFITTACVACLFWLEDPSKRGWLIVTAFMLGLAAGSKYQALIFLPLFFVVLIFRDRRASSIALASVIFLMPCIYWYARNASMTGDPFNPLGAKIFGFYDWNLQDYEWQLLDIKRVANWPKAPLWPLLLVPFLKPWRQNKAWRNASIFSFYILFVWYFTSHYDRYLVPAMPVLALLSAWVITESGLRLSYFMMRRLPWYTFVRNRNAWVLVVCIASFFIILSSVVNINKYSSRVASNQEQRDEFLRRHVVAYDLLMQLRQDSSLKIYQWGLEDAIYYAPNPIWGEVFGPWRYADLNGLSVSAISLRLREQGFNTLLIRDNVLIHLTQQSDFSQYFQILSLGNGAQAYRIISPD